MINDVIYLEQCPICKNNMTNSFEGYFECVNGCYKICLHLHGFVPINIFKEKISIYERELYREEKIGKIKNLITYFKRHDRYIAEILTREVI